MPSCDVAVARPAQQQQAPPTRQLVPAVLTLCSAPDSSSTKRPFIKCIVKVLKRARTPEDNTQASKKPKEDKDTAQDKLVPTQLSTMMSRTNLKQQLMREQMQQQEQKERSKVSCSAPSQTSTAIRVPLYASPAPQVPKQVLMVKSKLENPTPYHVRERQERQVREYLSHSHHNNHTNSHSLPTARIVNSIEPSPASDFSTAVSSAAASPDVVSPLDSFWNDFQTFNSCTDSVADNYLEPSLTAMPVTQPEEADILEVLSMLPALENVSTSCPAGLADVREEDNLLIEEKVQAFQKDRQKKDNHNRIERRRRFNINDRIKELGTLLPGSNDPYFDLVKDLRQNKGTILKASVDYVRCLKKEVQKIPDMEMRLRLVEQHNKKLLLRIQNLELQLKANNIIVNNSTWYPSTEADLNAIIKEEGLMSPPNSNGAPCQDKYFLNSQPNLATLPEHYENFDMASTMQQLPHSDPNGGAMRKRLPIMQFLTVKKESQPMTSSSCSQSPVPCCPSPAPSYSPFEDLMMEDDQPVVTGDPMLSSRDTFTPDHMDFMS